MLFVALRSNYRKRSRYFFPNVLPYRTGTELLMAGKWKYKAGMTRNIMNFILTSL
jgi:hypothetical protein